MNKLVKNIIVNLLTSKFTKYYLLLLLLLLPLPSLAVEGTCSYHNGVNCSAGYDYVDGSAICNDGWRDSSEFFGDMVSCKNQIKCSADQYSGLLVKYDLNNLMLEITSKTNQMMAKKSEYDALGTSSIIGGSLDRQKNTVLIEAGGLANEAIALRNQYNSLMSVVDDECKLLGQGIFYKLYAEASQARANYQSKLREASSQESKEQLQERLTNQDVVCGVNSTYDKSADQCNCNVGYRVNVDRTGCIKKELICPINSMLNGVDGKCYCDSGFVNKADGSGCVKNESRAAVIAEPKKISYVASFSAAVNVRVGASVKSKILATTRKNVKYKILDLSNKDWIKIEINNKAGWVVKKFAKITTESK